MSGILVSLQYDGAERLALRMSPPGSRSSGQALSSLLGARGVLVREDLVEEWRIEGAAETEEGILLYGPAFAGTSLDEACDAAGAAGDSARDSDAGFEALAAAASGLVLAAEREALPRGLVSAGLLLGPADELLILPPGPVLRAFRALGPEERERSAAFLRSPRAESPEAEASFLLAQVLYRYASGERAFGSGGSGGEIASGGFVPLVQLCPRLDPELAAVTDSILDRPESASLGRLRDALEAAAGRGWRRPVAEEDERSSARRLAATRAALDSRRRRAAFVKRRGGLLVAVAAVAASVLVVALSFADARRGRPDYASLGPRELVATYYRALDSLDLESMEACTARGARRRAGLAAARQDADYVSTMTVVSKARLAYEGKDPIVRAQAWVDAGKPPLDPERALYGITGLSVAELSTGPDRASFRAEYSSWASGRLEDGLPEPRERRLRDDLELEKNGAKGWKIAKIDRAER